MTYYVVIRRGVKDHVIEGPYASRQTARLARERYFFTSYDDVCDRTPDRFTRSHSHSYPIACCTVQDLPNWKKGSLNGVDTKDLPVISIGTLF